MAHECPDCGCQCHCGGDIDDLVLPSLKYESQCDHCVCPKCREMLSDCACECSSCGERYCCCDELVTRSKEDEERCAVVIADGEVVGAKKSPDTEESSDTDEE